MKKEGGHVVVLGLTPTRLTFILVTLISTTLLMVIYASETSNSAAALLAAFLPQSHFFTPDNGEHSKSKEGEPATLMLVNSANKSGVVSMKEGGNFTNQVNKESCNYAIGRWVADERRPFYSGARCKKWLSKMWACRFTQWTNFAFEKFRWQPKDCRMEEFDGSKFLQRMRDKTLAFIGDSLGRQQFQSLMCMIVGEERKRYVIDVGKEYGLVKGRKVVRPEGWAYRFPATNTTILFYWSVCLCDLVPLKPSNPKSNVAMHLDQPPAFLRRFLPRFDILILSTGHHWNRVKFNTNRWVMHVGGVPNTNKDIIHVGNALNFTIHSIVKWVDSQLVQLPNLKAFYRSLSPRHFFNGEWYNGGGCNNTIPLSRGKEVVKYESNDLMAAKAVLGTNVKLLDITALSDLRDEGHVSEYGIRSKPDIQDCLHWCLPGIPDVWNEIIFAQL